MSQSGEIFLNDKKYISSKRAGKLTGYTNDYVGQLCRGGKIDSQMIGRARFVDEVSLLNYIKKINGNKNSTPSNSLEENIPSQNKKTTKNIFEKSTDLKNIISSSDYLVFGQKVIATVLVGTIAFGGYKFGETPFAQASFEKVASSINTAGGAVANAVEISVRKIYNIENRVVDISEQSLIGAGSISKNILVNFSGSIFNTNEKIAQGFFGAKDLSKEIILSVNSAEDNFIRSSFEKVSSTEEKIISGSGIFSKRITLGANSLNEKIIIGSFKNISNGGKKFISGIQNVSGTIIFGAGSISLTARNNISNVANNFIEVQEKGKDKVDGLREKLTAYSSQLTAKDDDEKDDFGLRRFAREDETLDRDAIAREDEEQSSSSRIGSADSSQRGVERSGTTSLSRNDDSTVSSFGEEAVKNIISGVNSKITSVTGSVNNITKATTSGIDSVIASISNSVANLIKGSTSSLAFVGQSIQGSVKDTFSIYRGYSNFITNTSVTLAKAEIDYIYNIKTSGNKVSDSIKVAKDILVESPKLAVGGLGKISSIYRSSLDGIIALNQDTDSEQKLIAYSSQLIAKDDDGNDDAGLQRPSVTLQDSQRRISEADSSTDFALQNPSRISEGDSSRIGSANSSQRAVASLSSNDRTEGASQQGASQRGVERSGTTSLSRNDDSEAVVNESPKTFVSASGSVAVQKNENSKAVQNIISGINSVIISTTNSILSFANNTANSITNLTTSTKNKLTSLFKDEAGLPRLVGLFSGENNPTSLAKTNPMIRSLRNDTKTMVGDITHNLALAVNETNDISRNTVEQFAVDFYRTISNLFDREVTHVFVQENVKEDESVVIKNDTGLPLPSAEAPVIAKTTIINPIQERTIETVIERTVSGVTLADLQALNNELRSEIYRVANGAETQSNNNYRAIALTNKIDQLTSVTINDSTITGGTITGATFSGSTLSLTGTVNAGSGTFSGGLSTAGQLTVSGTATSTMAGDFAFDTNTLYIDSVNNRVGIGTSSPSDKLALNGALYFAPISAPSNTVDRLYNVSNNLYWAGNLIGGASTANWTLSGGNAYRTTGNVGVGTTSPTYKLSVEGISSLGNQARAGYFTATSTTATSTFAGNVGLSNTTNANKIGMVTKNGTPFLHNFNYGDNGTVTTEGYNTFVGENAGNLNMGSGATQTWHGSRNTAVGSLSLSNNTTGYYNSAFGTEALNANTLGYLNSAFGNLSLYKNISGYNNTAIGVYSLYENLSGYDNTSIGQASLYKNTEGYRNTSIGMRSLYSNTEGYENVSIGFATLYPNTTGYSNTAVGMYTMNENLTGYENTAIGRTALLGNLSGYGNSALGKNAGRFIANGSTDNQTSNTSLYLGMDTKALADGGSNEIVIGYNATGVGSNTAVLGSDLITKTILKGNIGIGTTSPYAKLSVDGRGVFNQDVRANYFTATSSTVASTFTKASTTQLTVSGKSWFGGLASFWKGLTTSYIQATSTTQNSYFMASLGIGTTSPWAKLSVTNTGANPSFLVEDTASPDSSPFVIDASGNVGIGTTAPASKLNINGGVGSLSTGLTFGDGDSGFYEFSDDIIGLKSGTSLIGFLAGDYIRIQDNKSLAFGSGNDSSISYDGANTHWNLQNVGSGNLDITGGNVGIGTTSPFAKLAVENTGSGRSFIVGDEANDASPFVVDASGNVGVGTMNPTRKFEISGGGGAFSGNGFQINGDNGYNGTGVLEIQSSSAGQIPLSILG